MPQVINIHKLPCGPVIRYRMPSDRYIISESGKKIPFFLKHGDIGKNDVMLDIGAQIGIITLWASTMVAHVHSFEPEPANWSMLEKNVGQINNTTLHNRFVCGNSHRGPIDFYVAPRNLSAHSAYIKRGRTKISVPTITIGQILQATEAKVVKLDCEGAEYDIILDGLLDFPSVEVITFEAHFGRPEFHTKYTEVLEKLRDAGYSVEGKESSKGWPSFVHASKRL